MYLKIHIIMFLGYIYASRNISRNIYKYTTFFDSYLEALQEFRTSKKFISLEIGIKCIISDLGSLPFLPMRALTLQWSWVFNLVCEVALNIHTLLLSIGTRIQVVSILIWKDSLFLYCIEVVPRSERSLIWASPSCGGLPLQTW